MKTNIEEIIYNFSVDNYEYSEHGSDIMEDDYYYVQSEGDEVLKDFDYILVEATNRGWRGTRETQQIIKNISIKEFISEYINPDQIELNIYTNKVEVINIHHDGRNKYYLRGFKFEELTKRELLEYMDKDVYYEDTDQRLYKASKKDLIDYIDTYFEYIF